MHENERERNASALKTATDRRRAADDFDQGAGQRRWLEGNNTYPSKIQPGQFSFD